jgi:hypothetical protein
MERFFFDVHGRDDDALGEGFAWLAREAAGAVGVVYVPGLQNADNLSPGLTAAELQQLKKHRQLRKGPATIELATKRARVRVTDRPVLAVWMDDDHLAEIERGQPASICAIPWNRDDITSWREAYGPTNMRSGAAARRMEISNPVVEAAMRTLTALVNLSTGLGHPSDKAAAVRAFQILRGGGESYSPAEIRAWAAANGWGLGNAGELEQIARGVAEGRSFRVEQFGFRDDILDQWRADAVAT